MGAAQIGSVVDGHTAGQLYATLILTVEGSIARCGPNVKTTAVCVAFKFCVTNLTASLRFGSAATWESC